MPIPDLCNRSKATLYSITSSARACRVAVARTGFEAIVKASCQLPSFILMDESLGDDDVSDTTTLLATCPATAHIPVVRLGPGRRLPVRMLSSVVRHR